MQEHGALRAGPLLLHEAGVLFLCQPPTEAEKEASPSEKEVCRSIFCLYPVTSHNRSKTDEQLFDDGSHEVRATMAFLCAPRKYGPSGGGA